MNGYYKIENSDYFLTINQMVGTVFFTNLKIFILIFKN